MRSGKLTLVGASYSLDTGKVSLIPEYNFVVQNAQAAPQADFQVSRRIALLHLKVGQSLTQFPTWENRSPSGILLVEVVHGVLYYQTD